MSQQKIDMGKNTMKRKEYKSGKQKRKDVGGKFPEMEIDLLKHNQRKEYSYAI